MFQRGLYTSFLLSGLLIMAGQLTGQQPTGGIEDVTYRAADGKITEISSEIKEATSGVSILIGGKVKDLISPAAIIKVEPKTLPGVDAVGWGLARGAEKSGDYVKALAEYGKLQKNLAAATERARRYVNFKEAVLTVKVADLKTGDEFKTEGTKAALKIASFARANKKSWEVWPAARTTARIYTELEQFGDAAAILDDLAGVADLPKELKVEAKLAQIAALIRAKQGLSAEGSLSELDKDTTLTAALKDRVTVLKACAKADYAQKAGDTPTKPTDQIKAIDDAIANVKDPGARGMGFNFLGDLYSANNMTRDAMWSYLWTDTVYNADKEEQLHALNKLAKMAEKSGDAERANFFYERMLKAR